MIHKIAAAMMLCSAACAVAAGQEPKSDAKAAPKGDAAALKPKASYSLGFLMAQGIKQQKIDLDVDAFTSGLRAAMTDAKPTMTEQEMREALTAYQKEIQGKMAEESAKSADLNLAAGRKFLEENKKKPGVKTTASGLQYKMIKEGTGPKPKASDTVKAHYTGTLINGKKFDSSVDRGEPATFPLNRVIKGWTEGLQLMPEGSKFYLYIPSDLAYGANPRAGGPIGPNETLIFEIELQKIEPAE